MGKNTTATADRDALNDELTTDKQVGVVKEVAGYDSEINYELSDSRWSIWYVPKRRKAQRYEVIERGAGEAGTARIRGYAASLEAALELAGSLEPSTVAEILDYLMTADSGIHRKDAEKMIRLATPGTRLWVMETRSREGGYAATAEGLTAIPFLGLFAGGLEPWSIKWRGDDGQEDSGRFVVLLEEAGRAWWIYDSSDRVVAGGPPIFSETRAQELAVQFNGRAVLGVGGAS